MSSFPWHEILLTLPLGAALGFFGGLFGIGGGVIAIPVLVIGFGMEQQMAQGTALVMMVPNLLIAWWRYQRHTPVAWPAMLMIGLSATLTTWAVAGFASKLDPLLLRVLFSVFIGLLAVRMLVFQRRSPASGEVLAPSLSRLAGVGMLGGASMGLLGMGGGLVSTPILVAWCAIRQSVAQSLSLALVAPSSIVALSTYAAANHVDWVLGLPLALGGLSSVSAGVRLAHRLSEKGLRQAFGSILLATACWMLLAPFLLA